MDSTVSSYARRAASSHPSVLECLHLGSRSRAILLLKENAIVLVTFEGRVEIHQVGALVFNVASKDLDVVAVVELVQAKARV